MITCRHMCAHLQVCVCVWLYSCIFTHRYTSAVVQSATHTWWVFQNHAHPPALLNKKTSDECQKYASLKNIDDINHLGVYLYCHWIENQRAGHYLKLTPNKCTTKLSRKIPIQHSQTTKKSMASLMFHLPPWMTGESPFLWPLLEDQRGHALRQNHQVHLQQWWHVKAWSIVTGWSTKH